MPNVFFADGSAQYACGPENHESFGPRASRALITYDQACALRAIISTDGMTAGYYPFEHAFLGRVANRIINECRGINRVTYDITSKPPGTIEWQ